MTPKGASRGARICLVAILAPFVLACGGVVADGVARFPEPAAAWLYLAWSVSLVCWLVALAVLVRDRLRWAAAVGALLAAFFVADFASAAIDFLMGGRGKLPGWGIPALLLLGPALASCAFFVRELRLRVAFGLLALGVLSWAPLGIATAVHEHGYLVTSAVPFGLMAIGGTLLLSGTTGLARTEEPPSPALRVPDGPA